MAEVSGAISLTAALLAGLAGSAHCVAMCGGLSGALSLRTRAVSRSHTDALRDASLYQLGRVGGYAMAGALFGLLGASLQSVIDLPALAAVGRLSAGLLIVLLGVRILVGWNALGWIERLGGRFWKVLQPLLRLTLSSGHPSRSLLLGFLWGWLPCGLVYSALLLAALTGDAVRGAGIMLAFGIGTLPAMLASSALASQLSRWIAQRGARQLSGVMLLLFGLWLSWAAVPGAHHMGHDGMSPAVARS